jgi:hypothetical protein
VSHAGELRDAIERGKLRIVYCAKELARFEASAGNSDEDRRKRRKLENDVQRAENDVTVLQHMLDALIGAAA